MQQWYQCPNCGGQVAFGMRFCGSCGTQLNWPAQQQSSKPPQQSSPPPQYQPPPPPQYQSQSFNEQDSRISSPTYNEVQALIKTAREGDHAERSVALSSLTLIDKPLDKQTQSFLSSFFISEVMKGAIDDVRLFGSVAIALAKYGNLQTLTVADRLWPQLIRYIEWTIAELEKVTNDQVDLAYIQAFEAFNGLGRFTQYRGEVTSEIVRIITMLERKGPPDKFSEAAKVIYLGLLDDALTAIGALGDANGANSLKNWKDRGNLAATVALEHFAEPYDIIRKARIKLEEKAARSKSGPCFVATAVYENPNHPDVQLLRLYRDQKLSQSAPGRAFIEIYYFCSPFLVSIIRPRLTRKAVHFFVIRPLLKYASKQLQ